MATDFEGLADELLNKYIKDKVRLKSVIRKEDLRVFLKDFDQDASMRKNEPRKFSDRFIDGLVNTNVFGNILSDSQDVADPSPGMPLKKFLKGFERRKGFSEKKLFYRSENWKPGKRFVLRNDRGQFVKEAPVFTENKILMLAKQPKP